MTDRYKPTWVPLWLRCGPCGHEWDDWQPSGVPAAVLIATYKALRCPKCGRKRKLFLRSTPLVGEGSQALGPMGVDETKGAEGGP